MAPNPDQVALVEPSSEEMTLKIKEILKSNGVTDSVAEVILKNSGLKGENFASETQLVTVQFEDPNLKPLNLFMKRQTNNPSHTAMVEECKMFEKETVFFMKYLPQAKEFCKRMGKEDLLDIYPKCYYGDKTMIIMENLVLDKGYTLLDKEELQDFEAARLALTTLAKHHAISYAFIKENGGPQQFFRTFPGLDFESFTTDLAKDVMGPAMENGLAVNINIIQKSKEGEKEKQEAISMLKSYQGRTWKVLNEPLNKDSQDETFRVLNHGDYWNNNMMFLKDNQTGKVMAHKAIDFQVTRYCSPSVDLGYYLYSSVKPQLRQSRLHELLIVYLEILEKTTKELGHPIPLTIDQLFANFREKFQYGFWFGTLLFNSAWLGSMKGLDPSKVDMSDWSRIMTQLIEKWIENNPEKSEENAKQLILLVKEYCELSL